MSESLRKERRGISADALWTMAMIFLTLGVVGRVLLENRVLGLTQNSEEELLKLLEDPQMMGAASVALVLQVISYCAVPLFAFLLVEGFCHTKRVLFYFLRILGLAVVCELPYNLAMNGKLWDTADRNPVFALALGLAILYFYRNYTEKSGKNFAVKLLVTVMAVLWVGMLRIDQGLPLVILVAALWALRSKPNFQVIGGCSAAIACSLISPLYMLSPLTFIAVHFYNGERETRSRWLRYAAYPLILLGVSLAVTYL